MIMCSKRQSKLPLRLNDYVFSSNVKYENEKYVNYTKLSRVNMFFATSLNKSVEPTCLSDTLSDPSWVEAMNNEIEALNRNNTWTIYVNNALLYGDLLKDAYMTLPKRIEVVENDLGLCMSQRKYCLELLHEYGFLAARPVDIPLPAILFLGLKKPYLKGSPGYGVQFYKNSYLKLKAHADADWAKCPKTKRFRKESAYCKEKEEEFKLISLREDVKDVQLLYFRSRSCQVLKMANLTMGSCTKSSNEMIPCTMKGKPLVLSWGQTSRLDSGVRVDMDLFALIHTPDPTKVKIVKQERVGDEPLGLDASVERLFGEGGSGNQMEQGDSIKGVLDADIQESISTVKRLLVKAVLNAEVRVTAIPTKPFVTSFVFVMPEREAEDHIDYMTGLNLQTISALQRFVISLDSSHHSGANVMEAEVDSLVRTSVLVMIIVTTTTSTANPVVIVKEKTANPSLFVADSSFADGADPNAGVFSILPEVTSLSVVSSSRQMSLSAKVRMRVEYNIKEKRRLKFVVNEKNKLLKVRALKEHKASLEKERDALDVKVTGLKGLAMCKDRELTDLNAKLAFVKSHNDSLVDQKLSSYENLTEWLEEVQDAHLKIINDKFDKLYADFMEMALHLEEGFYPYLFTTIFGCRWLLTHGMALAVTKCLHSPEYLCTLKAAIGKPLEKGTDLAKITKKQPKPDKIEHEIVKIAQKPNPETFSVHKSNQNVKIQDKSQITSLGAGGTSNTVPATAVATMALSTILASASIVAPISVDDNEVAGTDDQAGTDGNADSFPNVNDAELNMP
uniref:Ribonuclease H-like domain-containing protein n=1 Tax=Tanacetum cinerariifolium TaxID=118510 RepID=A0A6L2LMT8_TANCI|nr:ribonuclease H-like domain-containing protein [Tanacetum cinerariifolium]